MESEFLHDFFFDGADEFVFFLGFVGVAEAEHFYFVELVYTDDSGGVFTVGSGFTAEAGGISTVTDWKFFFGNDFFGV